MKNNITILLILFSFFACTSKYKSLDPNNPITFNGDYITYKGKQITLGPKAFFIDGQLSNKEVKKYKYVYNSINEATKHLAEGTENEPMVLYIAPYVYWIDNPDDPEIRMPKEVGGTPIGLEINCPWLRFYGLSDSPQNVVLACNRGQTMGAKGNFTMFNLIGDGVNIENITFGNYCNIDLVFPLKPEMNREKRGSAIVQAQLAFCHGDRMVARNSRFVSRLNLVPLNGGKRTLFDHCHFESTDDALETKGLYLNCDFEFYAPKPFGHTSGTGAILLNCDMKSFTRGEQYLIKGRGPIAAVDCRMTGENTTYWGWKEKTPLEDRHYQYNNQFNDKPVSVDEHRPYATVDMTGKRILDAYRLDYNDSVVYNIYNLLKGDDDWDPINMKELVLAAEKAQNKTYTNLPTLLKITPSQTAIETGKETAMLKAEVFRFGDYEQKGQKIIWAISPEYKSLVKLTPKEDGTCEITPTNKNDETTDAVITASTPDGLEAACVLSVMPKFLDAPKFSSLPKIVKNPDGKLKVNYNLDMRFEDQSLISWYRCSDAKGNNPIEIEVSRLNKPKYEHELSAGDVGYYLMATVTPKHIRCHPGKVVSAISEKPVSSEDIKTNSKIVKADMASMSTKYQPNVIPGFWTLDCFAPEDTHEHNWTADTKNDSWYYGVGENGASEDTGFVQATKGARLRYTPIGNSFGDMMISFTACPAKTAGQGFSSARAQYLDVCIKLDTKNLNGYALRLVRTTKYHDAIDFVFMKFENGVAKPIGDSVSASCFRTPCFITFEAKGNKLIAHAKTSAEYYIEPNRPEVNQEVNMETTVEPNTFGGIEIQHTGTVGSGATLIKDLTIEWK